MALEDLNPSVRVEEILDGADIEPATRLEYFMKKAANEVPKPAGSSDAGKAVLVNEDGDGFELGDIPSLPSYTSADIGKVLTVGENGAIWSGETVRILVNYDVESNVATINAPFSDIYNLIQNGAKVALYSVYEGVEYDEGYIRGISAVTAPVLWLNKSMDDSPDVTTATAGSASDNPTYTSGYGVEQIEFTLNGSTWSCNKTYAQLKALGFNTPVYAEMPIPNLPQGGGMMTLTPAMHMTHGEGISCTFDDTNEPFSKNNPDRYYISGEVFADGFVSVDAHKYSVGVTTTDMLA